MYQTVLKRYELISPYPFFVAVKVFLITCLVLLVFVFSLVSPIQSQGFLVLHSYEGQFPPQPPLRLSSLCAWHIHRSQSLWSAGPGRNQACGSSSEVTNLTFRLHLLLCSHLCCRATPQSAFFSSFSIRQNITKCIPGVYTQFWRVQCLADHCRQRLRERDMSTTVLATGKLGQREMDLVWVK